MSVGEGVFLLIMGIAMGVFAIAITVGLIINTKRTYVGDFDVIGLDGDAGHVGGIVWINYLGQKVKLNATLQQYTKIKLGSRIPIYASTKGFLFLDEGKVTIGKIIVDIFFYLLAAFFLVASFDILGIYTI